MDNKEYQLKDGSHTTPNESKVIKDDTNFESAINQCIEQA